MGREGSHIASLASKNVIVPTAGYRQIRLTRASGGLQSFFPDLCHLIQAKAKQQWSNT